MPYNLTLEELKKVMYIPLSVIFASFIIIIVTTSMTDTNGLSALFGGYSGLLIGMLFMMILITTFTESKYLDMFPIVMILIIVSLLLFYLGTYFERISKGEISQYYFSFSILSTIFLLAQSSIVVNSINDSINNPGKGLFSDTTFSLLGLISVINILIVLTLGIILKFYSTQG